MDNRTSGEPEITHKNTRIRPIPLRDVLEAIMDYAFVTSEYEFKENKYFIFNLLIFRYPIIISIENHCSPEQRFNMSRMFIEIFGGKFYIEEKEILKAMSSRQSCSITVITK
jgi:hypothetical protein